MTDGLASFGGTSYSYDELIAGETISVSGTLVTGQGLLLRGQIVGKDGVTGKWDASIFPPAGILVHDTDTTAGDVVSVIHIQGKFKDNVVIPSVGKTVAECRAALWDTGVYLLDVQE